MEQSELMLLVFLSCAGSGLVATWICRQIALQLQIVDQPNSRKVHNQPRPYLGGVALLVSLFVPLLWLTDYDVIWFFFIGALLVTSLGLVDDLYDLSGTAKILGLSLSVSVLFPADIAANFFVHFPYGEILNAVTTIFWVVFMISAVNAIDNMDGLAGGIALIASFMFFVVGGIQFNQPVWALISLGFVGSLLGFLVFNFYPATIFLGDAGSFLVGFVLAMLAVMGEWSTHPLKSIIVPTVILIIPILDLAFVVLYRYLTGVTDSLKESIEYSAKDHLSHRIQQVRNFGQRRTVLIIYVLCTISGLMGVVMRNTHPFEATLALASACLLYVLLILLLLPNLRNIFWRW